MIPNTTIDKPAPTTDTKTNPTTIGHSTSSLLQSNGEPRYWILYYHYGNIPQLIKSFRLDGTMRDAVLRARKHCDILNIKFIKVRPLIVDLDLQERMYLDGKYRDPSQDE